MFRMPGMRREPNPRRRPPKKDKQGFMDADEYAEYAARRRRIAANKKARKRTR